MMVKNTWEPLKLLNQWHIKKLNLFDNEKKICLPNIELYGKVVSL